ncbi:MAG: helix-turn-helix domain-containing protein, partial [Methanoculleus sp.]
MLRAYKYRMYPSQEQVASLMHHIHACRFMYNKAIQKLARCHEKITNQRNDLLHKLSNRVVGENQAIAVESLNV